MSKTFASSRGNWQGLRFVLDKITGTLYSFEDVQTSISKINSKKIRIQNANNTEHFEIDLSGSSVSVSMSNNVKSAIRNVLEIT